MYGVASRTLHTLIKTNKTFEGSGRKFMYLSREEEIAIVDK